MTKDLPTQFDELKQLLEKVRQQSGANAQDGLDEAQRRLGELESQVNTTVHQIEQARSKFVSVVTHELRIPMTSIKGYTDLLKAGVVGQVNEQQLSFLDTIRNNVERMSVLVSDLADISRMDTGRMRLDCRPINVATCIEEAAQTFAMRLAEKQQTLEKRIALELPQVYADPNRVGQIIANLLSNAHKYSLGGTTIGLEAAPYADGVRIAVIDQGIGIAAPDQEKLFSQFFRSENAAVREQQGWGLGLSVAKRLAEVMGGQIGYASQLGQGSTFWFTLPTENHCDQ